MEKKTTARLALLVAVPLAAALAMAPMASANTSNPGQTSGGIDSGGAATTFGTTRTILGGNTMSITQTGSTQSSATNIALRQCSNNNFITAGQILTDSVTKAYSIGNGACYRITMNRSNPKDTNGFGFGNGVTTVNITLA